MIHALTKQPEYEEDMLKPIRRLKTIPIFQNKFGTLFNDHVVGPSEDEGYYLRWKWARHGVAIIPMKGNLIGLCLMYRYPIQASSIEIPRGGIDIGETIEAAAIRELREETGLIAESCQIVGEIYPDSGIIESAVSIVEAKIEENKIGISQTEPMESISQEIVWTSVADAKASIRCGKIKCAITIAAIALLNESVC